MSATYIKICIGSILFGTWVALVVFHVPETADLIGTIKLALTGLGLYHIQDKGNAP